MGFLKSLFKATLSTVLIPVAVVNDVVQGTILEDSTTVDTITNAVDEFGNSLTDLTNGDLL